MNLYRSKNHFTINPNPNPNLTQPNTIQPKLRSMPCRALTCTLNQKSTQPRIFYVLKSFLVLHEINFNSLNFYYLNSLKSLVIN
jgi:hypothetical protein